MKRFGQYAILKPEFVERYRNLHRAVWPEVLEIIKNCNIRNYSIYLRGDTLFAYYEYVGNDYEADMMRMEADPVTQEWWKLTKPCFANHEKRIYYTDMNEIFHCD